MQININKSVEKEWIEYMLNTHIKDVMATGFFLSYNLLKLLDLTDLESTVYQIRYRSSSMEDYQKYIDIAAGSLQKDHNKKFGGNFTAERSLYEVINNWNL